MKSFGLWYKKKDKDSTEPSFDVHVNFWSESIKTKGKKKRLPYLDIGLKITDYQSIEQTTLQCPFKMNKDQLRDLSESLKDKKNANLIFNVDGEIATKDQYVIYQLDKEDSTKDLLFFPLSQELGTIFKIEHTQRGNTNITFLFKEFIKYIESDERKQDGLKDIKTIYIRFRIITSSLKDAIYFDSELLNKSFESAFSGTRIIDFKINEKRNLDKETITQVTKNGQSWSNIGTLHLLIMEPSSYDLEPYYTEEVKMSCRELEGDQWNDYLGEDIDLTKGHILAYHLKLKEEFSCLVKIKYSKAQLITIVAYILVVISLGIFSSLFVTYTPLLVGGSSHCFAAIDLVVAIFLFVLGIILGKVNK